MSQAEKELYDQFETENHFTPVVAWEKVVDLHGAEFDWEILDAIQSGIKMKDEAAISKRLSPGQKALWFFWYLDGQVTNGGFIQFYWNGYRDNYFAPIVAGLQLLKEYEILELVERAEREFKANIDLFIQQKQKDDSEPLYEALPVFEELDTAYYALNDAAMETIERYIRAHPGEFVKFE
jgi:Domain of unknown function (DUF4375)